MVDSAYGEWDVSTYGDQEGKSIKDLGRYTGYIDEIAFHFADKAIHEIIFKKVISIDLTTIPKAYSVNISIKNVEYVDIFIFKDRPVEVSRKIGSNSFNLKMKESYKEERIKRQALSKLTDEEIRILGL